MDPYGIASDLPCESLEIGMIEDEDHVNIPNIGSENTDEVALQVSDLPKNPYYNILNFMVRKSSGLFEIYSFQEVQSIKKEPEELELDDLSVHLSDFESLDEPMEEPEDHENDVFQVGDFLID